MSLRPIPSTGDRQLTARRGGHAERDMYVCVCSRMMENPRDCDEKGEKKQKFPRPLPYRVSDGLIVWRVFFFLAFFFFHATRFVRV